MSLTLARLCGEWQLFSENSLRLVSENYEARSRKYKALIAIIRISTADYFIAEYRHFEREIRSSDSDLLYICCHRYIFPDFSESGKPLRKIGTPLKKSKSRFRKRKAGEENRKAVEEIGKPFQKAESR